MSVKRHRIMLISSNNSTSRRFYKQRHVAALFKFLSGPSQIWSQVFNLSKKIAINCRKSVNEQEGRMLCQSVWCAFGVWSVRDCGSVSRFEVAYRKDDWWSKDEQIRKNMTKRRQKERGEEERDSEYWKCKNFSWSAKKNKISSQKPFWPRLIRFNNFAAGLLQVYRTVDRRTI